MINPFNTLTGRMVLVTVTAVLISYAVAFAIFSNERGAALRRAAELGAAERIAFTAERLQSFPAPERPAMADAIRDFSIRYAIAATPEVAADGGRSGARIARAVADRLPGAETHARTRVVDAPMRHRRGRDGRGPRNDHIAARDGLVRVTEAVVSVRLSDGGWLNARARLPGPRPAPLSVLAAAIASIFVVGAGAALVSRQIGRPLADLAAAARALGAGQTNVSAPVSGPDDVKRASTAFNAMAERLGRQLNRQRQMLWALSHDLRTPITAIRLRAEMIESEGERQRLLASVAEMEALTEQALALARAGASEEARSRVDVGEIVRTLAGELQDMGLDIRADAPEAVVAECRPSEIARALRNLAENAAKYGGGGVIRAYRNTAGEVIVEVLDEGPGVAAEQIERLTAPFFRADEARSASNGNGLGLAIAQAIADSHGGRLVLENRAPRGFRAALVLPA
ncbi:MAG: HAMP domain-containing sensor histidine kinase [Hyphomonadaceae bacterium]